MINKIKIGDYLKEQDLKFPNRHKEIHKDCCKNCPSNIGMQNGNTDPESAEIKTYPKERIVEEYLFVCGWRPNKLCKGLCDYMEIDERFIKECNEKTNR